MILRPCLDADWLDLVTYRQEGTPLRFVLGRARSSVTDAIEPLRRVRYSVSGSALRTSREALYANGENMIRTAISRLFSGHLTAKE